jgi:ABC-type transport system involved in multi-copper enzyme maturation permease subunit
MLASLKSELRKIRTIRSTYVILAFAVLLIILFAFWTEGIKAGSNSAPVQDQFKLASLFINAITNLGVFGALVGILSLTHEYRYNTIMYTLTSAKSRTRSLFAKVAAVSLFSIFFTVFVGVLAIGAMYLGLAVKGLTLGHQTFDLNLLWHALLVGWGYSMFGLIIATFIRHQAGTIAAFFLIPGLVEQLAGLLLKDNRAYLPFMALSQVGAQPGMTRSDFILSPGKAACVVLIYVIVGWLVAWYLFLRRDAN